MAAIKSIHNPWRDKFLPASFRGAQFHVEQDARASGRRIVLHEFPKRDDPYAEDMGRKARRYTVQAYLIGPDYLIAKDRLIDALEKDGPGELTLPLSWKLEKPQAVVEGYSVTQTRERGGFCTIDMNFCEAGIQPFAPDVVRSAATVQGAAGNAEAGAASRMTAGLAQ